MGPLIMAWLLGEGIITWRSVHSDHHPPIPGQMLAATGLFALLALLAQHEPARGTATLLAYGLDLAVLLQPGVLGAASPPQGAMTGSVPGPLPGQKAKAGA